MFIIQISLFCKISILSFALLHFPFPLFTLQYQTKSCPSDLYGGWYVVKPIAGSLLSWKLQKMLDGAEVYSKDNRLMV
jgi:hypothetical protein